VRKQIMLILVVILLNISTLVIYKFGVKYYNEEQIKSATVIVKLVDDLNLEFDTDIYLEDLIAEINGKVIDNKKIDTTVLGSQKIDFKYKNDEGIEIPYSFEVNVVDTKAPQVWLGNSYTVTTKFNSTLEEKIICVDNYDDEPICKVEGDYDTKKVGKYNLVYSATDSSGNETRVPFVLNVNKPSSSGSSYNPKRISFSEAVEKYKTDSTAIGIDVSSWQGDINFQKLKEAGVEFAFVRVGSKWGSNGEYFLDSKFERNIQGFNEAGIPVGIYFYSYAKNEQEAREEAEWIIEKVKNYKVDLPIAFDFEDWSNYNKYKMSLYRLNRNAEVFIETLENAGYEGMLYSSLNYLGKVWDINDKTVWLAHYTSKTGYQGDYTFWQFSNAGRVDGIYGDVDLNIWYKKDSE